MGTHTFYMKINHFNIVFHMTCQAPGSVFRRCLKRRGLHALHIEHEELILRISPNG